MAQSTHFAVTAAWFQSEMTTWLIYPENLHVDLKDLDNFVFIFLTCVATMDYIGEPLGTSTEAVIERPGSGGSLVSGRADSNSMNMWRRAERWIWLGLCSHGQAQSKCRRRPDVVNHIIVRISEQPRSVATCSSWKDGMRIQASSADGTRFYLRLTAGQTASRRLWLAIPAVASNVLNTP
jgi:hypothetical protein